MDIRNARLWSGLNLVIPLGLAVGLILCGGVLAAGSVLLFAKGLFAVDLALPVILIASGIEIIRSKRSALHLFLAYFILSWVLAISEIGLDGWSLLPRVDLACAILPLFWLPPVRNRLQSNRLSELWQQLPDWRWAVGLFALLCLAITLVVANCYTPQPPVVPDRATIASSGTWPSFGGEAGSDKFSGLAEITPKTAGKLQKIWEYVEPAPELAGQGAPRKDEVTPLQVDGKVFVCQPDNVVLALDAETGRRIWRFDPQTHLSGAGANICRGLAYASMPNSRTCVHRLLMGTMDARLMAIDAETGLACKSFGKAGQIDLTEGLGLVEKGYYYVTSPPTIVNGIAVVGALVRDNQKVGEPSGVVRAFDVETGQLRWAWDMGRVGPSTAPLKAGETYTRGTPNAWSIFSADPALGLIFLPMGNATPDFVGQHRKAVWETYASAVVALDVKTGQPRWHFQTVHHDLWDYDLSAQPILADMPDAGVLRPAVIIATKRGDIFVLDRKDGHPVSPVEERAVPATDVPGEWTAKTQPFPAKMPSLGGAKLTDKDMWGITPFDRLFCRVTLRKLRYDGDFTPPSEIGSLIYPGMAGGVDWGGMSVDPGRHWLIVPTLHIADRLRLVKRAQTDPKSDNPQVGTTYGADLQYFISRLGIPCQRPPYARLTAIDLTTQKIVWQRALGTAESVGPLGIATHLPFTLGTPPIVGGLVTTGGDVTLIGAVGDRRLRVLDSRTGHELWSTRLPAGNQATPITYRAPTSGKQVILIVSGGWADLGKSRRVSSHIIAYAIKPEKKGK